MSIDFFTNNRYKILACMQQCQIKVLGSQYVPLSQRQIAGITGIAYGTVNSTMKSLQDNGYVIREGSTRGQYSLTAKAVDALSTLQNLEAYK
jgi:predicted transcriptional regulator